MRFPNSTEGIPRMTSTLSISSVEMERISTPLFVMLRLFSVLLLSLVDENVFDSGEYCRLASVLMGAPSTTNKVPKEVMA